MTVLLAHHALWDDPDAWLAGATLLLLIGGSVRVKFSNLRRRMGKRRGRDQDGN